MHIGRLYYQEPGPLIPSYLLNFMDRHGIEKAALLPIESPEETHYYITTDYVLRVCGRHPDRFVPFCNVDPRRGNSDLSTDFRKIITEYRDRGCRGLGELMCGLWIDDPRMQMIYQVCGDLGLPIIFHMDALRDLDEKSLPRMEAMARKFPDTTFIGHGPHFWAEVSGDVREDDFGRYPEGPVAPGGAVERLLGTCPNVYADLSAGSAYNPLTRDPSFGPAFLEKFRDKLLFGTDICRLTQEFPIFEYLRTCGISNDAYRRITGLNAAEMLKLGSSC